MSSFSWPVSALSLPRQRHLLGWVSGGCPGLCHISPLSHSHSSCTRATPAPDCTSEKTLHLPGLYPFVGIVLRGLITGHFWLAVPDHPDIWNTDPWEACHVNRALQQSYFVSIDGGIAAHRVIRVDSKNLQIGSLKWWNHYRNLFNWLSGHSRLVEPAKSEDSEGGFCSTGVFFKINFCLVYISLEHVFLSLWILILIAKLIVIDKILSIHFHLCSDIQRFYFHG